MHAITLPQDLSRSSGFSQVVGKPDGELLNMGGGQLTAKRPKIGKKWYFTSLLWFWALGVLSQCPEGPQFGAYVEQHL